MEIEQFLIKYNEESFILRDMQAGMLRIQKAVQEHRLPTFEEYWAIGFLQLGSYSLQILRLHNEWNEERFVEMLLDKHRLYGSKPIRSWGGIGVIIRIDSKIERYVNITQCQKRVEVPVMSETAMDTMRDILGYCVLGYKLAKER